MVYLQYLLCEAAEVREIVAQRNVAGEKVPAGIIGQAFNFALCGRYYECGLDVKCSAHKVHSKIF